jgi:hypothetical protein
MGISTLASYQKLNEPFIYKVLFSMLAKSWQVVLDYVPTPRFTFYMLPLLI